MDALKNFTLHQIKLISQLGETQGIRDLARKNSMDPASITRLLQDLEGALGFSLATRTKRGLLLTPEGSQAVALARELVTQIMKFEDLKKIDPSFARIPTYNLGSRAFLSTLLAEVIAKESIAQTKVKFRFLDSSPTDLLRASLTGSIDLAVHIEHWSWPESWVSEDIASLSWGLVARTGHPLKSKVKTSQTQAYPFVGVSYLAGERIERSADIFPLRWSERRIGHECQTAASSKMIIQSSDHIAFLPLITVADEIETKRLRVIEVTDMELVRMRLRLSVNKDRVTQQAQALVRKALTEIHLRDQKLAAPLKGLSSADEKAKGVSSLLATQSFASGVKL
jgi:DNA-binding transcriptional LysR family regulator